MILSINNAILSTLLIAVRLIIINASGLPDCDDFETRIEEFKADAQLSTPAVLKSKIFTEINKSLNKFVTSQYNNEIVASKEKYMALLNARISELSPKKESAAPQPVALVTSILQVTQPSDVKGTTNETSDHREDISKLQQIIGELQTAATVELERLQIHKDQQLDNIQKYYDSLRDSPIDQTFIEAQQNVCGIRGEELWVDVAMTDHRLASILRNNQIDVPNYFQLELHTKIEDVKPKIESSPEYKKLTETPSDFSAMKAMIIDTTCNLYISDLDALIEQIKEVDGSLATRSQKVENIPTDLERSWNLMRVDLGAIYLKLFDSNRCELLGLDVFQNRGDTLDYFALATEIYARILNEVHPDVEKGINKMHLFNFLLTQMNL